MSDISKNSIEIQASAEDVRAVLFDSEVKDNVVLDYDWSKAPDEVSFTFDDADLLTDMFGTFSIKDNGDETTTVSYELTVALSMPVPAMMRQKQERTTIDLTLAQLKEKVEA